VKKPVFLFLKTRQKKSIARTKVSLNLDNLDLKT
jgi:hypothetical protein